MRIRALTLAAATIATIGLASPASANTEVSFWDVPEYRASCEAGNEVRYLQISETYDTTTGTSERTVAEGAWRTYERLNRHQLEELGCVEQALERCENRDTRKAERRCVRWVRSWS